MNTLFYLYPQHDILRHSSSNGKTIVEKEWERTPKGIEIKKRLEPYKNTKPFEKIEEKEPIWEEARERSY